MATEAQIRAANKWNEAHRKERYDQIGVLVPKGDKKVFQKAADEAGETLSFYIANATRQRIAREKEGKD